MKAWEGRAISTPDLRDVDLMLWRPTGPSRWHEHFDHGHSHKDGDQPHIHEGIEAPDWLTGDNSG